MLDELVKVALIGTGRGATSLPAAQGALGDALTSIPPAASNEARLLTAAAVVAAYESCGQVPESGAALPGPAAPDALPSCSRRAGELLDGLLAMPETQVKHQLLDEWLGLAARAGQRPPHRSLPAVLDYAAAHRAAREPAVAVLDERGRWLIAQNPAWQFAARETDDARQVWSTGSPDQRLAALRRLRQADPPGARDLIQATWNEDGADERAAFVGALKVGLNAGDEGFLESALDDRSKQVRAAAAEVLTALPGAALLQRMTERADAILHMEAGTKAGWIRKGKSAVIDVTLPAALDASWVRDGILEKPTLRMGERQWWARQVIAAVPPVHWSTAWQCAPAECIAAVSDDFTELLLAAWGDACERHPDVAWVDALLNAGAKNGSGNLRVELLNGLPEAPRLALVTEMLESPRLPIESIARLLNGTRFGFDGRAARALAAQIDQHVSGAANVSYDYALQQVVVALALRLPPEMHDALAGRWVGPYWEMNRKALDQCLATMQVRRDIQREFAT